jgi:1-acyl-sn-glycerol-3-phosphate acyltransferase
MLKEGLKAVWYRIARAVLRALCLIFFRLRVFGRENIPDEGAFILASNHQSYLDPVLCGVRVKRQLWFLARESLFSNRFFGWLISSVGSLPLKRGQADMATVRQVIGILKEGKGVCLFPEGTRTNDGKIEALKPGLGLLCRRGNAAIVPTVVDGAFECWPRHKKMFSLGSIWVQYGKAISAEQAEQMGDDKLAEVLTDTLRRMQNDLRTKQGKAPYNY